MLVEVGRTEIDVAFLVCTGADQVLRQHPPADPNAGENDFENVPATMTVSPSSSQTRVLGISSPQYRSSR